MKLHTFDYDQLTFVREGKWATLVHDINIALRTNEGSYLLKIEAGFKWNGNSGCFPCRFSKTNERYNVAILVHDALYHRLMLKEDADDILRGCLRECGYGRFMAGIIHRAVTLFGTHAYTDDDDMTRVNKQYLTLTRF